MVVGMVQTQRSKLIIAVVIGVDVLPSGGGTVSRTPGTRVKLAGLLLFG